MYCIFYVFQSITDIIVFDAQVVLSVAHGSPFKLAATHDILTTLKVELTVLSNLTTSPKQRLPTNIMKT